MVAAGALARSDTLCLLPSQLIQPGSKSASVLFAVAARQTSDRRLGRRRSALRGVCRIAETDEAQR